MQKQLIDQIHRRVTYTRFSVTDRCNYRCTYCMSAEGLHTLGKYQLLTFEEIVLICHVFVEEGIQNGRCLKSVGELNTVTVTKCIELSAF